MRKKILLLALPIGVIAPVLTTISCGVTDFIENDETIFVARLMSELQKLKFTESEDKKSTFETLDLLRRTWPTEVTEEILAKFGVEGDLPIMSEEIKVMYTLTDIPSTRVEDRIVEYTLSLMIGRVGSVSKDKVTMTINSSNKFKNNNLVIANEVFNEISKITSPEHRGRSASQLSSYLTTTWEKFTTTEFEGLGLDGRSPEYKHDPLKEVKYILKQNPVNPGRHITYSLSLAGYYAGVFSTNIHNVTLYASDGTDLDSANKILAELKSGMTVDTNAAPSKLVIKELDQKINIIRQSFEDAYWSEIGLVFSNFPSLSPGERVVYLFTPIKDTLGAFKEYELRIWGIVNNTISDESIKFIVKSSDFVSNTDLLIAENAINALAGTDDKGTDSILRNFVDQSTGEYIGHFASQKTINEMEVNLTYDKRELTQSVVSSLGLSGQIGDMGEGRLLFTMNVTRETNGKPREYNFTIWGEKNNTYSTPLQLKLISKDNSPRADTYYLQSGAMYYYGENGVLSHTIVQSTYFGATPTRIFQEKTFNKVAVKDAEKLVTYGIKPLTKEISDTLGLEYNRVKTNGTNDIPWTGEYYDFPNKHEVFKGGEYWEQLNSFSELKIDVTPAELETFLTTKTTDAERIAEGLLTYKDVVDKLKLTNVPLTELFKKFSSVYSVFWLTKNTAGTVYYLNVKIGTVSKRYTLKGAANSTDKAQNPGVNANIVYNSDMGYTLFPLSYNSDKSITYEMFIFMQKGLSIGANSRKIIISAHPDYDDDYYVLRKSLPSAIRFGTKEDLSSVKDKVSFSGSAKQSILDAIGCTPFEYDVQYSYEWLESSDQNVAIEITASRNGKSITKEVSVMGDFGFADDLTNAAPQKSGYLTTEDLSSVINSESFTGDIQRAIIHAIAIDESDPKITFRYEWVASSHQIITLRVIATKEGISTERLVEVVGISNLPNAHDVADILKVTIGQVQTSNVNGIDIKDLEGDQFDFISKLKINVTLPDLHTGALTWKATDITDETTKAGKVFEVEVTIELSGKKSTFKFILRSKDWTNIPTANQIGEELEKIVGTVQISEIDYIDFHAGVGDETDFETELGLDLQLPNLYGASFEWWVSDATDSNGVIGKLYIVNVKITQGGLEKIVSFSLKTKDWSDTLPATLSSQELASLLLKNIGSQHQSFLNESEINELGGNENKFVEWLGLQITMPKLDGATLDWSLEENSSEEKCWDVTVTVWKNGIDATFKFQLYSNDHI